MFFHVLVVTILSTKESEVFFFKDLKKARDKLNTIQRHFRRIVKINLEEDLEKYPEIKDLSIEEKKEFIMNEDYATFQIKKIEIDNIKDLDGLKF